MSTISRKNPLLLAKDFSQNFKQYESYLHHCINILKVQNWLKQHQFDPNVSDYEYMFQFMHNNGVYPDMLFNLYQKYTEEVVSKLNPSEIKKIYTNKYYVDGLTEVVNMFTRINDTLVNNRQHIAAREQLSTGHRFKRLYHLVLTNGTSLEDREYSEHEILDLVLNGNLLIAYSDAELVDISEQKLLQGINSGNIDFANRDFSGVYLLEKNTGDAFDLFEAHNEEERKLWFAKNMLMLKYIRKNQISFDKSNNNKLIQCSETFDITCDHIDLITKEVAKTFTRRKKNVPSPYITVSNKVLGQKHREKENFYDTKANTNSIVLDTKSDE